MAIATQGAEVQAGAQTREELVLSSPNDPPTFIGGIRGRLFDSDESALPGVPFVWLSERGERRYSGHTGDGGEWFIPVRSPNPESGSIRFSLSNLCTLVKTGVVARDNPHVIVAPSTGALNVTLVDSFQFKRTAKPRIDISLESYRGLPALDNSAPASTGQTGVFISAGESSEVLEADRASLTLFDEGIYRVSVWDRDVVVTPEELLVGVPGDATFVVSGMRFRHRLIFTRGGERVPSDGIAYIRRGGFTRRVSISDGVAYVGSGGFADDVIVGALLDNGIAARATGRDVVQTSVEGEYALEVVGTGMAVSWIRSGELDDLGAVFVMRSDGPIMLVSASDSLMDAELPFMVVADGRLGLYRLGPSVVGATLVRRDGSSWYVQLGQDQGVAEPTATPTRLVLDLDLGTRLDYLVANYGRIHLTFEVQEAGRGEGHWYRIDSRIVAGPDDYLGQIWSKSVPHGFHGRVRARFVVAGESRELILVSG